MTEYSIKVANHTQLSHLKNDLVKLFSDHSVSGLTMSDCLSSKETRTMVCTLLIIIFMALAIIILIISIFLSNFRIRSTIEKELSQMGVLKAIGYTGQMMVLSRVIPYIIVALIAPASGALLSYLAIPSVAKLLAIQSGFSYQPVFDLTSFVIVIFVPAVLVLLFSVLSAKKP